MKEEGDGGGLDVDVFGRVGVTFDVGYDDLLIIMVSFGFCGVLLLVL